MSYASMEMPLLRIKLEGTSLTPAERLVLRRIAMGDSQYECAERLGKSYETIRKQMKAVRARLGARTTCQAVAIAISLDLI